MMFVDASAIAAILLREERAELLIDRLSAAARPIASGIVLWEASAAILRERKTKNPLRLVEGFVAEAEIEIVPIGLAETRAAFAAFAEFGKATGHRAALNLGDCFSYGCALVHGVPLLYKGEDFIHTPLG
jgi:ribonuclease VapC